MSARAIGRLLLALLVVGVAASCIDNSITGVRTARMALSVTPTTLSAGGKVAITYDAEGTGIARIVLNYGDGVADTSTFSGPVVVSGDIEHTYAAAGTYILVGTVGATAGVASDSVTITVN
jgi:hypothetical protein